MKYGAAINAPLLSALEESAPVLAFGQNIGAGSHLSGLTSGISDVPGCSVLNTPNCENAQVGFGFGHMLEGGNGIFIVKQQDFLLLCLDQLVNTANVAIREGITGSFTLLFVTVDSGYEGPQSRLNNFADICALTRTTGYTLSSRQEADHILPEQIGTQGFRMIGVSQRMFRSDAVDLPNAQLIESEANLFKYREGDDLAIIACNFALPYALSLADELQETAGMKSNVISVPRVDIDESKELQNLAKSAKRAVIIDDSHCRYGTGQAIAASLQRASIEVVLIDRTDAKRDVSPNSDTFTVDANAVLQRFGK